MLECNNNTEIVVHDNGSRLASSMYYEYQCIVNMIQLLLDEIWDEMQLEMVI